jgi:hypothetical protein
MLNMPLLRSFVVCSRNDTINVALLKELDCAAGGLEMK